MKEVFFEDKDGFKHKRLIKNADNPSMAEHGIHLGPPDLHQLDMENILREMNNLLVDNGLFTWDNVQRFPGGINVAVNAFRRALVNLYRESYREEKRSKL